MKSAEIEDAPSTRAKTFKTFKESKNFVIQNYGKNIRKSATSVFLNSAGIYNYVEDMLDRDSSTGKCLGERTGRPRTPRFLKMASGDHKNVQMLPV